MNNVKGSSAGSKMDPVLLPFCINLCGTTG